MKLRLGRRRQLDVIKAPAKGGPAFVSAASGLVIAGDWFYVVADDELHLGVFPLRGDAPGRLVRLLPGALPRKPRKRKARKPDFEVLVRVGAGGRYPGGALLALGSGSRPNRCRGVVLPLAGDGTIAGPGAVIDLLPVYTQLAARLGALNVEGAVVAGARVLLLHRGHPETGGSAVVSLGLRSLWRALDNGEWRGEPRIRVVRYDLGSAGGVPLGFTDATALSDGSVLFTAVAEQSRDSYRDGPCAGSAVGLLRADGRLGWIQALRSRPKVEGIAAREASGGIRLHLVTDADDRTIPATLLAGRLTLSAAPQGATRRRS